MMIRCSLCAEWRNVVERVCSLGMTSLLAHVKQQRRRGTEGKIEGPTMPAPALPYTEAAVKGAMKTNIINLLTNQPKDFLSCRVRLYN